MLENVAQLTANVAALTNKVDAFHHHLTPLTTQQAFTSAELVEYKAEMCQEVAGSSDDSKLKSSSGDIHSSNGAGESIPKYMMDLCISAVIYDDQHDRTRFDISVH